MRRTHDLSQHVRHALERHPRTRVVSVDVFDTLLIRRVEPAHALELEIEAIASAARDMGLPGHGVETLRTSRAAWDRAHRVGFPFVPRAEWATKAWLEHHATRHGGERSAWNEAGRIGSEAAERASCRLVEGGVEALRLARERRHRVIAVSDTWHQAELLQRLLEHFGLVFDHVFTSGTEGASKRNGDLFDVVAEQLGVAPAELLHIGDHWKSDVVRARTRGWRVAPRPLLGSHLARVGAGRGSAQRSTRSLTRAFVRPLPADETSIGERIGRHHLAPLLVLFWLQQRRTFEQVRAKHILFVARDAYLPRLTAMLLDEAFGAPWSHSYVRLSRRSISLLHPSRPLESAQGLPGRAGKVNAGGFLRAFDLPHALREAILETAGLKASSPWNSEARNSVSAACHVHRAAIADVRSELRARLLDYLREQGLPERGPVGIVDVGWAGTVQDVLAHVLHDTHTLHGTYLGVSDGGAPPRAASTKTGLFRDDYNPIAGASPGLKLAGAVRLWDAVLREPIGSASGLRRARAGRVEAIVAEWGADRDEDREFAAALRRGAEAGVRERIEDVRVILRLGDRIETGAIRTVAAAVAERLVLAPRPSEARALLRLQLEEVDGRRLRIGREMAGQRTAWLHGMLAASPLRTTIPALNRLLRGYGRLSRG